MTTYYSVSTLKRFVTIRRNKHNEEMRARLGILIILAVLIWTLSPLIKRAMAEANFQPFFSALALSSLKLGGDDLLNKSDKHSVLFKIEFEDGTSQNLKPELSQNERQIDELGVEEYIRFKARENGINEAKFVAVIKCESNFNHQAVNWQGSSAVGLLQFTSGTWQEGCRRFNKNWTLNDRFNYQKATEMAILFWKIKQACRWKCYEMLYPNEC